MKLIACCLLFPALAMSLSGCRLGRYELTEPLDGQCVEVKSGDRLSVELEENATTGYLWMAECNDEDVSIEREEIEPDKDDLRCGVPRKVRFIIRIHRGYAGLSHVKFAYRRPWEGGGTAREIDISLYRKPEDNAPWK